MKKITAITLGIAVVLGGSIAINHGYAQEDQVKKAEANQSFIGMEKAKSIALEQVDGSIESIELERSNGQVYYDVDIDNGNKDFDLHVDAVSATILKVEESLDDDYDDNEKQASSSPTGKILSEKEAIAIAKKHINGEVVEIQLDEDDGRYEYELEFKTAQGEAEITIDTHSKKVVELEMDEDENDD